MMAVRLMEMHRVLKSMSELTGLQRIEPESVDGVSTNKYTATV